MIGEQVELFGTLTGGGPAKRSEPAGPHAEPALENVLQLRKPEDGRGRSAG